ncbi:MAG: hypothetical protein JSV16_06745 [Candidatus Hydrogenedentota bacterium]|nr:MAG: hypothetical protein JSV16_06745 [Candidatus Hydrogenedentota bacterium]
MAKFDFPLIKRNLQSLVRVMNIARMLIKRNDPGDNNKARNLLLEAAATYREIGMPTFLENADELPTRL